MGGKSNNRLEHESIQAGVQAYGASIFEEAWLRACRQNKKQWLNAKHRKARVQWCERDRFAHVSIPSQPMPAPG